MEASDVSIERVVDVDTGLREDPAAESTSSASAPEANLEASFAATVNENAHVDRPQPQSEDVTTNTAVPGVSTPPSWSK